MLTVSIGECYQKSTGYYTFPVLYVLVVMRILYSTVARLLVCWCILSPFLLLPLNAQVSIFPEQEEQRYKIHQSISSLMNDTSEIVLTLCPDEVYQIHDQAVVAGQKATLRLKNKKGFDSLVLVKTLVYPRLDFEVSTGGPICLYDRTGRINIENVQGGTAPFRYSLDNRNYHKTDYFMGKPAGDYQVYVRDANGCVQQKTISVNTYKPLDVRVDDQIMTCNMDSVVLSVNTFSGGRKISNEGLTYIWQDGSDQSTFTVYKPGIYWVEISNECETVFKEVLVAQASNSFSSPIYIPNAFSPNGDGYNDLFRGYAASGVEVLNYELRIYDQWGKTIYYSRDISKGWDGVYETADIESNSFLWLVKARVGHCGKETDFVRKGDLALLR